VILRISHRFAMASNSPGLKSVNYAIFAKLQEYVYHTRIRDVDHFVERFMDEWSRCDHEITTVAVSEWKARLRACVKANGGHFEHFHDN